MHITGRCRGVLQYSIVPENDCALRVFTILEIFLTWYIKNVGVHDYVGVVISYDN